MEYGMEDMIRPSLMSESSTRLLRPTEVRLLQPPIGSMSVRKSVHAYEQRVREVEHSSFIPLVLSASGGMGTEASIFYKRLATLLADKWDSHYSRTLCWLRCRLSFSLLRSSIQALRGARSSRGML